jgi:LacI family transcriptional regulator
MDTFEIARLAGVSRRTVTRVINNHPNVHPKTRDKVMLVIQQTNFQPNASARQLSGKKTKVLGLFVIQDIHVSRIFTDDLYFGPVIAAIINAASLRGYNVMTFIYDIKQSDEVMKFFFEKSIDAGIFISWIDIKEIVLKVKALGFPLGVFDQNFVSAESSSYPSALLDNKKSAYQAVEYLIELGHSDIGMITGSAGLSSSNDRLFGYKKALKDHHIPLSKANIFKGDFSEESGINAIQYWLNRGKLPTAIFAANDWMAIGALNALTQLGLKVPEDVSLIGLDDIIISRYTSPSLTTMKVPVTEMADFLTNALVDHLENKQVYQTRKSFTAELIQRLSCKEFK